MRPLHNCGGIGADGTTHPELAPWLSPPEGSLLRRGFACQNGEQSLLSAGPAGLADGTAAPPEHCDSRGSRARQKNSAAGQALDHKNRKAPISKPAANAQRPNVQAETTRTRLRRSCGISSDRSVILAAPLRSSCWGRPLWTGQYPAMDSS